MARLTRNGYKRKMIVFGAFLFMSIALTVTGFAAWVMSTNAKNDQNQANVEVGVVQEGNLTITLTEPATPVKLIFDPKEDDTTGRVRKDSEATEFENLTFTVKGKVSPIEYLANLKYELVLPAGMQKAVEYGYIVLPEGCSYAEGTTAGKVIYQPSGVVSGDHEFTIVITFQWGAAFNGLNPGEYFDSTESFTSYPDTAEGNAKVKKVLEDLRAMVYGYYDLFFVSDGETVDYTQPVSDSARAAVIEAHKNDAAPTYKLVITATAN